MNLEHRSKNHPFEINIPAKMALKSNWIGKRIKKKTGIETIIKKYIRVSIRNNPNANPRN